MRTEPDLPALLHVVDAPDVLGEVGAGSVGVVALVLWEAGLRLENLHSRILTMTESRKFDNRTSECQLIIGPLHIGVDEEKDEND